MKLVSALVLALLLWEGPSGPAKEITREQARQLVLMALKAQGTPTKSPKFDLENGRDELDFPEFYNFEAYFDTKTHLATIGFYAVGRKTADIWESVGCHRLDSPAIRRLQRSLRKKIGLTEQEYQKLTSVAPCSGD